MRNTQDLAQFFYDCFIGKLHNLFDELGHQYEVEFKVKNDQLLEVEKIFEKPRLLAFTQFLFRVFDESNSSKNNVAAWQSEADDFLEYLSQGLYHFYVPTMKHLSAGDFTNVISDVESLHQSTLKINKEVSNLLGDFFVWEENITGLGEHPCRQIKKILQDVLSFKLSIKNFVDENYVSGRRNLFADGFGYLIYAYENSIAINENELSRMNNSEVEGWLGVDPSTLYPGDQRVDHKINVQTFCSAVSAYVLRNPLKPDTIRKRIHVG